MAHNDTTAPDADTSAFSLSALFGVQGRVAVITGGGTGLGSYSALALALQGARVYIIGRRQEKLQRVVEDFELRKKDKSVVEVAKNGKIIPLQGDISTKDSIQKVVNAFSQHEKHLDVLINGAGIMKGPDKVDKDDGQKVLKSLWEEDWSDFEDLFNVNVISLHYVTLAFAPYLDKAKKPSFTHQGPVVINIASIAGLHINRSASIPYQTSKDAVIKLSKIQAGRFFPLKIRVNVVCPGVYPSEMTKAVSATNYEDPKHPFHDSIKATPLQRSGTVEDFAGLTLFLTSRAGAYLNGSVIVTDGARVLTQSAA